MVIKWAHQLARSMIMILPFSKFFFLFFLVVVSQYFYFIFLPFFWSKKYQKFYYIYLCVIAFLLVGGVQMNWVSQHLHQFPPIVFLVGCPRLVYYFCGVSNIFGVLLFFFYDFFDNFFVVFSIYFLADFFRKFRDWFSLTDILELFLTEFRYDYDEHFERFLAIFSDIFLIFFLEIER